MTTLIDTGAPAKAKEYVARAAGESRPVGYLIAAICIGLVAIMMAPLVLFINGLTKHDWLEALLFALARLNAILLPLNYRLANAEISAILAQAGARRQQVVDVL